MDVGEYVIPGWPSVEEMRRDSHEMLFGINITPVGIEHARSLLAALWGCNDFEIFEDKPGELRILIGPQLSSEGQFYRHRALCVEPVLTARWPALHPSEYANNHHLPQRQADAITWAAQALLDGRPAALILRVLQELT